MNLSGATTFIQIYNPNETEVAEDYRMSLRKLGWIEGEWGAYSEEKLMQLCEGIGVEKRGK